MTLTEFINAITCEFVDKLVEERAMAFIHAADIATLRSALVMRGVTAKFLDAINTSLVEKAPNAQAEAALARITADVAKHKGPP